jgi:DNA-binding CsgD family transcriptional regulator
LTETSYLSAPATDQLTPRELEVLRLVTSGLDNRSIGRETWHHSLHGQAPPRAVYGKLEVHGRAEAVREGLRRGLIPL